MAKPTNLPELPAQAAFAATLRRFGVPAVAASNIAAKPTREDRTSALIAYARNLPRG